MNSVNEEETFSSLILWVKLLSFPHTLTMKENSIVPENPVIRTYTFMSGQELPIN